MFFLTAKAGQDTGGASGHPADEVVIFLLVSAEGLVNVFGGEAGSHVVRLAVRVGLDFDRHVHYVAYLHRK